MGAYGRYSATEWEVIASESPGSGVPSQIKLLSVQ